MPTPYPTCCGCGIAALAYEQRLRCCQRARSVLPLRPCAVSLAPMKNCCAKKNVRTGKNRFCSRSIFTSPMKEDESATADATATLALLLRYAKDTAWEIILHR